MSTSSNNAESKLNRLHMHTMHIHTVCLNKIDQEVLKNIPYALLIKKTHLKLLDCVGQG